MSNTFESFLAPIKELNELALKSIEEITALQVKAIQDTTKVNLDALKSAADIKDADTLQKYLTDQVEIAQSLSTKAVEDAQEMAKLGESYANSVKEIVEKSVPKV